MFGRFSKYKKEKMECPYCTNKRIIDYSPRVVCYVAAEEDFRIGLEPHFYVKCKTCKNEIGIFVRRIQK